jgi:tetratricopeptide (TPR) repeat protein
MQVQEQQGKPARSEAPRRFVDVLSHVVHRLRYGLWGALIAIAVFLVGWFIWGAVNQRISAEATLKAEQAQTLYSQWVSEADTTKKADLERKLLADLDGIIARYPRQYGAQRALLLRADLRYELKDWSKAEPDYRTLARRFPQSYLAPTALYDAAVCLEEESKPAEARALYAEVATKWKDNSLAPRALFDAGRLAEGAGDWTAAQQYYDQIDAEWPTSQWDALAKNRLIALKVAGKIQSSATSASGTPAPPASSTTTP